MNIYFYLLGLLILFLTKMKRRFVGYRPKPFDLQETERCIDYDLKVFTNWNTHLIDYLGKEFNYSKKNILELGPGADLGIGFCFLGLGARKYVGLDVNGLIKSFPDVFYEKLFEKKIFKKRKKEVKKEYERMKGGTSKKIEYRIVESFKDLKGLKSFKSDLIVSQAAFEHFDSVPKVIYELSKVSNKNAILISEIDFMTHTRWLRESDPNNIYRFGEKIYELFSYQGMPNRVRPDIYSQLLKENGWVDIKIIPLQMASPKYLSKTRNSMNELFIKNNSEMNVLSAVLLARKR